jgi:hypothetical protein
VVRKNSLRVVYGEGAGTLIIFNFLQEVGETAAKKFKKGDRVAVDPNK